MYIAETLFTARPDCENRVAKEVACYDQLETLGIPFAGIDHNAADTIALCHEIEGKLGAQICKNLFLTNSQKTNFYLLLMPGDKPFKTKFLSKQLGCARLSFGDAEHMEALLGVTPGSVTVLGLMHDTEHRVQLVIDKDLCKQEFVGCHPCINTSTLRLALKDITEKLCPALEHSPVYVDLPNPEEME